MRGTQKWPPASGQAAAPPETPARKPAVIGYDAETPAHPPELTGYARVSTRDQHPELQQNALRAAGCERIFTDHGVSGKLASRPELDKCLAALQPGDTLVVWKLDRLGRSLQHLVEVVNGLKDRGVGFRSLTEQIDTSNGMGKLVFHIFAALAEFERDLIVERTLAGLEAAREKEHYGGRPRALTDEQARMAARMLAVPKPNVAEVGRVLGVSRATVYRAVERIRKNGSEEEQS